MTLPEILGFCCLLVGVIAFAAKLAIENDLIDIFALIGFCATAGYMARLL